MQRIASMIETTQLLADLRKVFQKTEKNIVAYIIPSDDAHNSEYICPHDERRAFISGFNGSAGTAVVTNDKALLWTDGRYYQQAEKQLDSNWTLMKDGLPTTPRIGAWLAKNLQKGSKIGFDPKLISYRAWQPIKTDLEANECELIGIEENLIDIIWHNQPCRQKKPIITLDLSFTGLTIKEKWNQVRKDMDDKNVECLVVSALDEVAWFLNMRGDDIGYNPVFFAYLVITHNEIMLYVDSSKLPNDFEDHQQKNQVKINILEYEYIKNTIQSIESSTERKIWISPTSSYFLNTLVPRKKLHQEITSICLMKAIKNPIECEGFIQSHIRDGIALCQYFAWLEEALKNNEYVDEISGAAKLEEFRSTKDHFKGISFSTISSSGPNGSIIHYRPTPESNRQIISEEIYLCDSGAQYLDGTTDVTRTMHFGEPTDFQKEAYTRVLKGQLNFAATIFPKKVKGQVLDTLARKALWDIGLDYGHGTGHGVGHFLNVHEGPMGCGIRLMPDDPGLQENMFISNEPGYYKDGEFGLRIEDIVQIVEVKPKFDFSGRGALGFKTITMCPKQTKMVKKELLTENEIKQLNDYHKEVWDTLSPILESNNDTLTLSWLKKETIAI
ncbi:LOW QUALITY PROTEIN: xaa-Pro aminopeptidase ApepP-like [Condylostylus longicornis]|uniref:LOW QUALITY PROTEIN: xaa-Pro aminopeptidase ApepP-like n=1 Tax=Condylostylus longicornis TaxID=2530218 RepID=UPI00244DB57B|nr:LOW QUALITY PROTEIN: xaa-Pro aminopeptidase ApepP-like [Condylostylus longicornis]